MFPKIARSFRNACINIASYDFPLKFQLQNSRKKFPETHRTCIVKVSEQFAQSVFLQHEQGLLSMALTILSLYDDFYPFLLSDHLEQV